MMDREQRRREWLTGLKVGDQIVQSGRYGSLGTLHTINRETGTRFYYKTEYGHESWFHKKDGHGPSSGGRFPTCYRIDEPDEEFMKKAHRARLINDIDTEMKTGEYRKFPTDVLQKILDVLREQK